MYVSLGGDDLVKDTDFGEEEGLGGLFSVLDRDDDEGTGVVDTAREAEEEPRAVVGGGAAVLKSIGESGIGAKAGGRGDACGVVTIVSEEGDAEVGNGVVGNRGASRGAQDAGNGLRRGVAGNGEDAVVLFGTKGEVTVKGDWHKAWPVDLVLFKHANEASLILKCVELSVGVVV